MVTNFCEDANWVLYITDHKHTGFNTTKESSMTQHLSLERLMLFVQMIKKHTEGHGFWI